MDFADKFAIILASLALKARSSRSRYDKVREAFQKELSHVELLRSNLSNEQETKLREDFGTV